MTRNTIGHLVASALVCGGLFFGLATPPARGQALEWVRQFGTSDGEFSLGVSADGLGNVYTSGITFGSLGGPQAGNGDAFISKYDAAGTLQWTRQLGTTLQDDSASISADGLGNVYISGDTQGSLDGLNAGQTDAFVSKYDAAGNLEWTRQLGTASFESSHGVSADGLGNVYISGETGGSLDGPNAGPAGVFISKYDAAGNFQWTKQMGTYGIDQSNGVSADGLGNVFISGYTGGSLRSPDAFVSKYDAEGNLQWTKQLTTAEPDESHGVSADGLGNVYISGYTGGSLGGPNAGQTDAFVSKYDAAGNVEWTRQLGTAEGEESFGVSADGLGNVYISGLTTGSLGGPFRGLNDAFVSNYDASGNLQWTTQLGTNSFDVSHGVSADGRGNVYISGETGGSLDGPNAGSADPFIAKYCVGCEPEPPEPVAPLVVDVVLPGEKLSGSLVTHQFTTSLGDLPITWSNLVASRPTENPPTLTADGLFNWQTSNLDRGGLYHFDVTATNAGGSDTGRLSLRLAIIIIPEPSALVLLITAVVVAAFFQGMRKIRYRLLHVVAGSNFVLRAVLLCGGLLFGLAAPPAHAQMLDWVRQLGTASNDTSYGVSADGLGNVYISGYTNGSLGGPHAGGLFDVFVSKYDEVGNLNWVRQFGAATVDFGYGVSADGLGNIYITGHNSGRVFVSKLDSAGALQWTKQLGDYAEWQSVSADGLGNVYISGNTTESLGGPNAGHLDAYVAKYDEAGNLVWTSQYGTPAFDVSRAVSADALGNVYIAGYIDTGTGPPGGETTDAFVSKYDATGNFQWTRQLGTANQDIASGVSADGFGNVYISGQTSGSLGGPSAGSSDVFLAKYDGAGNLAWSRQIGTYTGEAGGTVSADGLGNVYLAGGTQGNLVGGPDAGLGRPDTFVIKFDSAGNVQWTQQLGTPDPDPNTGVSADGLGNVYISGYTSGNLGGLNAGGQDAFVAKYNDIVIPEPTSWLLAAFASAAVLCRCDRRRKVADRLERIRTDVGIDHSLIEACSSTTRAAWLLSRSAMGRLFSGALMCGGLFFGLAAPSAHAQVLEWVRQLGGSISEPETSWGVSADGLGSVYIAGSGGFGESSITNTGQEDAFLSKFDAAGQLQWTQRIETDRPEIANGVSADGLGNVYIAGWMLGGWNESPTDAYVAKYDATGMLQWTRQFGTKEFRPVGFDGSYGVSADALGNVYVVGETTGNLNEPDSQFPPVYDAFVRKYDADGEHQWTRQFGAAGQDFCRGVSTDGLGNVFIAGANPNGAFVSKYDATGDLEWMRQLENGGARAVSADSLGNVFVSGSLNVGGSTDVFLSKYDTAGEHQWTQQFGSSSYSDNGLGVSADGLGDVYVTGIISSGIGSREAFLSKYNAEGALQWTKLGPNQPSGVATDGEGNIYVSGSISVRQGDCCPLDPGDSDPFLAKYIDCPDCEPPAIPPIVVDMELVGQIGPGSLVTHQFTTSFGDPPVTWSNLLASRGTENPPTLTADGLFSWQTSRLDRGGTYHFDATATNAGGSDTGRLTLRLAFIPEPSALLLLSLGICSSLIVLRARCSTRN